MSVLIYTIDEFNNATRQVKVSFGEEGHAVIQLNQPFPTSKAELDVIVSQYAPALEVMVGRSAVFDATWLTPMLGKPQVCSRNILTPVVVSTTPTLTADQIAAADLAYKQRVAKALFDLGVTSTNLLP